MLVIKCILQLGTEPRALCLLSKCFPMGLDAQSCPGKDTFKDSTKILTGLDLLMILRNWNAVMLSLLLY